MKMKTTEQMRYRTPDGETLTRDVKILLLKILKEGQFTDADKEGLRCGLHSPMVIFDSLRDCKRQYENDFADTQGQSPCPLTKRQRSEIKKVLKAGVVDERLYLEFCAAFGIEIFCVVFTDD